MGALREQIRLMRRLETARVNGKPSRRNKAIEGLSIKCGPDNVERAATLWLKVDGSRFSPFGDDRSLLIRLVSEPDFPETTLNTRTVDGMLFVNGEIYVARLAESRSYLGEWLEPDFSKSSKAKGSCPLSQEDMTNLIHQLRSLGPSVYNGFSGSDKKFINKCFEAIGLEALALESSLSNHAVSIPPGTRTLHF